MTVLIQNKPVMSICESIQNVNNLYKFYEYKVGHWNTNFLRVSSVKTLMLNMLVLPYNPHK